LLVSLLSVSLSVLRFVVVGLRYDRMLYPIIAITIHGMSRRIFFMWWFQMIKKYFRRFIFLIYFLSTDVCVDCKLMVFWFCVFNLDYSLWIFICLGYKSAIGILFVFRIHLIIFIIVYGIYQFYPKVCSYLNFCCVANFDCIHDSDVVVCSDDCSVYYFETHS